MTWPWSPFPGKCGWLDNKRRAAVRTKDLLRGWKAICAYLGQSAYRIKRQRYPVYQMPGTQRVCAIPEELDAHTTRLFAQCRDRFEAETKQRRGGGAPDRG